MKIVKILSILYFGLILSSCTDIITLDLEDPKPVLVVDGYISDIDTTQWVRLSNLENYFADGTPDFTVYKTAKVKLIEDSTEIANYTFIDSTQRFEIQYKGINGKSYQIDILLPDGKHYTSSSELMQIVPKIDSLWYTVNQDSGTPGPKGQDLVFSISTQETPGIGDNYQWKTYINDAYRFEVHDLNFSNDQLVDGQYIFDFEVFGLSKTEFDEIKQDAPNNRVFLKIEQSKITSKYYDFLFLVFQQTRQVGGPFAAPPAEIKGNVFMITDENQTALGYFYSASIHSQEVEVTE